MAQGQRLSDRQIETIRLAYAETGSVTAAARAAGCSRSAARSHLTAAPDNLAELRQEKRADIVAEIAHVRLVLLTAMGSAEKIAKASMAELATSFGILTDKHQLLTGGATSRPDTGRVEPGRLTPEEREQAARLRAKLLGEAVVP
jgi:molybdenum-dependent DNA-binding transcriptional regulator ModE